MFKFILFISLIRSIYHDWKINKINETVSTSKITDNKENKSQESENINLNDFREKIFIFTEMRKVEFITEIRDEYMEKILIQSNLFITTLVITYVGL